MYADAKHHGQTFTLPVPQKNQRASPAGFQQVPDI
jgi:hypothetical protein